MKIIFRIAIIVVLPPIIVWNFINRIFIGALDGVKYGWWDTLEDMEEARKFWRKGMQALPTKKESP